MGRGREGAFSSVGPEGETCNDTTGRLRIMFPRAGMVWGRAPGLPQEGAWFALVRQNVIAVRMTPRPGAHGAAAAAHTGGVSQPFGQMCWHPHRTGNCETPPEMAAAAPPCAPCRCITRTGTRPGAPAHTVHPPASALVHGPTPYAWLCVSSQCCSVPHTYRAHSSPHAVLEFQGACCRMRWNAPSAATTQAPRAAPHSTASTFLILCIILQV